MPKTRSASRAQILQNPLLSTKLHIPVLRANLVSRPRLLARLDAGLQRKLTLVSAPAGFGKTTLFSEWQASPSRQSTAIVWVSLDEQDNDPIRFWSYVVAALERAQPRADHTARELLHLPPLTASNSAAWIEAILTALINDLAGEHVLDNCVLVLDDYHLITAQAIHASLTFLLDHLPACLHVAILSRSDPPLSLARLRARNQLLELRAADLRFNPEEATAFFNQTMGLSLTPEEVVTLEQRTEGWAAGLQLAALSLQGRDAPSVKDFVETFAGTNRHIMAYLMEEVLQRQSPHVQAFLLQTSILRRLSAPVCQALTEQADCQATLESLTRDNSLITPLDDEGRWYRYHHLFADALHARLQQLHPELVLELHRRAAAWYEANGPVASAMFHAIAAQDFERAAFLVESVYPTLVMDSELVTLQRWLDALPPGLVRARPRLSIAYAWSLGYSGSYDVLERYLQQALQALESPSASDARARLEALVLQAVALSRYGQSRRTIELAQQALQLFEPVPTDQDQWLRLVVLQALGNAYRLDGNMADATSAYQQALSIGQAVGSLFLRTVATNRLGQVQVLQGKLRQAEQTFQEALRACTGQDGKPLWFAAELFVQLGNIYREWNRLALALQYIQTGIELAERAGNPMEIVEGYLALARVQWRLGDYPAAREALGRVEQVMAQYRLPNAVSHASARKVRLALIEGDLDTASAWADHVLEERAGRDALATMLDMENLLLARVRLAQGRSAEALQILAQVRRVAGPAGRIGAVIGALALEALVFQARGNAEQAAQSLQRALALAEPGGYIRLFVDEGEPIRFQIANFKLQIQKQASTHTKLLAYAVELLEAFGSAPPPAGSQPPLVEALTARELEILKLAAAGASNRDIADTLVISTGTVKGHINHILGKLQARSRTEAAARAREMGLL